MEKPSIRKAMRFFAEGDAVSPLSPACGYRLGDKPRGALAKPDRVGQEQNALKQRSR
ncbi:hypothetical protein [Qipengyuania sp.]|uniref:hypothetical protein n=1 Tax=Qipengyuania sp. TaxID=2004515 RepID=UPI003519B08C